VAPEAGTPDYWRALAARVRAMLGKTRDPQIRDDLLFIIASYERLAERAEEEERRRSAPKDE
jgi:hypothetical protein